MKVLNQITDNIFTVELEESDKQEYTHIAVAHDYVRFIGRRVVEVKSGLDTRNGITGPFRFCDNAITVGSSVTISIHDMIRLVLPYLSKHEYLQEAHLHREGVNGSCYSYSGETISMWLPTGRTEEKSYTDHDGTIHNWKEEEFQRHFFVRESFENEYRDMDEKEYDAYSKLSWEEKEEQRIKRAEKQS